MTPEQLAEYKRFLALNPANNRSSDAKSGKRRPTTRKAK